jgi:hypothetical protein
MTVFACARNDSLLLNWMRGTPGIDAPVLEKELVAGKSFEQMLGHETVTTGVAGPEIADEIVGEIGGSFRRHH